MPITNPHTKEVSHVGQVLIPIVFHPQCASTDMEIVYATVWNPEKNEPEDVPAGIAAYGLQERWATADASEEYRIAYANWLKDQEKKHRAYTHALSNWDRVANTNRAVKTAIVVKGYKVKPGTQIEFSWVGTARDGRECGKTTFGVWINRENFAPCYPKLEIEALVEQGRLHGLNIVEKECGGVKIYKHDYMFHSRRIEKWVAAV